jgi:hypothetical protein
MIGSPGGAARQLASADGCLRRAARAARAAIDGAGVATRTALAGAGPAARTCSRMAATATAARKAATTRSAAATRRGAATGRGTASARATTCGPACQAAGARPAACRAGETTAARARAGRRDRPWGTALVHAGAAASAVLSAGSGRRGAARVRQIRVRVDAAAGAFARDPRTQSRHEPERERKPATERGAKANGNRRHESQGMEEPCPSHLDWTCFGG